MKSIFQKITVQKVVKGFRYLKHYGWKEFIIRLQEKMEAENIPYEPWYEKNGTMRQRSVSWCRFLRHRKLFCAR